MILKDRNGVEVKLGDYCWLAHKVRITCFLSKVQVISLDEADEYTYKYKIRFIDTKAGNGPKTKTLWYIDAPQDLLRISDNEGL